MPDRLSDWAFPPVSDAEPVRVFDTAEARRSPSSRVWSQCERMRPRPLASVQDGVWCPIQFARSS